MFDTQITFDGCVDLQSLELSHHSFPLTFARFAIATQAKSRATAASPRLLAIPQQTDVGAASSLPKLVLLASVAAH